jgi:hypothetical protein
MGRDNLLKGTVCRRGQPVRVHLKAGEELLQVRPLDWTLVGGDRRAEKSVLTVRNPCSSASRARGLPS